MQLKSKWDTTIHTVDWLKFKTDDYAKVRDFGVSRAFITCWWECQMLSNLENISIVS